MARKTHFTTGEVALQLGIPVWLARRIVDDLGEDIPRVGLYRLVPAGLVGRVRAEARRRAGRQEAAHVG
jgi:hypothetical protein